MNESQLHQVHNSAKVIAVLLLISMIQTTVQSQTTSTIPPVLSQSLISIREAEAAGATRSKLLGLIVSLNNAVYLYREANNLSTQKSAKQAQLMVQVTEILTKIQTNASYLASEASKRNFTNRVITYAGAALAATIGTAVYAFAVSFYRKSRIKRTLQMRISSK